MKLVIFERTKIIINININTFKFQSNLENVEGLHQNAFLCSIFEGNRSMILWNVSSQLCICFICYGNHISISSLILPPWLVLFKIWCLHFAFHLVWESNWDSLCQLFLWGKLLTFLSVRIHLRFSQVADIITK